MSFISWSFDKLEAALDIRAMSVRLGSVADMIIIATSSDAPLPDHIKRWLDAIAWQQRNQKALLIALEDGANTHFAHLDCLCQYLRQLASHWNAELICCADLHHPPGRQAILQLINDRFHQTLPDCSCGSYTEPDTNGALTMDQAIEKIKTTMTPAQIQEVRGVAYHLWLKANRPAGGEIDFWLRAEQQVIQAAAEKTAAEATPNAASSAKSSAKKPKLNLKPTK